MREEAKNWLEQSQADFDAAQANLQIRQYFVSAFFFQQSAEKSLKALAIQRLGTQVKTHSLLELAEKLDVPDSIRIHLRELNPDYTVARYPDAANGIPAKVYDSAKGEAKLKAAYKVLAWVNEQLK